MKTYTEAARLVKFMNQAEVSKDLDAFTSTLNEASVAPETWEAITKILSRASSPEMGRFAILMLGVRIGIEMQSTDTKAAVQ